MAEEPAPPNPPPTSQSSTTSESSRTAAALSALSSHSAGDGDGEENSTTIDSSGRNTAGAENNDADTAALGRAVQGLSVEDGGKGKGDANGGKAGGAGAGEAEVKRKAVKIDAGDVAFLVTELELSKSKATELLRVHGGERMKAVRAFVVGDSAAVS